MVTLLSSQKRIETKGATKKTPPKPKKNPLSLWGRQGGKKENPVFCDHLVIIADLMKVVPARLRSLGWKVAEILKSLVGAVRSMRPISKCKIMVWCDSSLQQSRLVKKTNIGQVEVRCTIPQPTVQGASPHYIQMDKFMRRIEWVSGSEGKGSLPTHLQGRNSLGSDPSHVHCTEAASVDENQQAGIQRQAVRGPGTTLL